MIAFFKSCHILLTRIRPKTYYLNFPIDSQKVLEQIISFICIPHVKPKNICKFSFRSVPYFRSPEKLMTKGGACSSWKWIACIVLCTMQRNQLEHIPTEDTDYYNITYSSTYQRCNQWKLREHQWNKWKKHRSRPTFKGFRRYPCI